MDKNNIGKEGDAFKIGEDGTIIRVKKDVDYQKYHKVITICLITLCGLREIIRQAFLWNDIYYEYIYCVWYGAILVVIVNIVLLCTGKVKLSFGLISLLVGISLVFYFNSSFVRIWFLIDFVIVTVALIYVSKFSLIKKSKNI
ncbi:MAG: hypothetical protein LBS69_01085 [Prevotellaceae bacterium]|jgi:hypothetical protein|nr:hypothetical protein [Prevotellaceae bacterium]